MSAPQVRMDKSRDYATTHGERLPGDRDVDVHFTQDGLPFNAAGILLSEHPMMTAETPAGAKLRRKVERRLEKLAKAKPIARASDTGAPADDDEDEDRDDDAVHDEEDEDDDGPPPVNLEAWAKGEEEVQWNEVTQAIARRYAKRVANKRDALELLIEERVVAVGALSVKHRKALEV